MSKTTQHIFQRCFNVVFWLMRRHDVGQRQINVETTLYISTLKFTTSNNVETTLSFSTLSFYVGKHRNNVVKMTTSKKNKKIPGKIQIGKIQVEYPEFKVLTTIL